MITQVQAVIDKIQHPSTNLQTTLDGIVNIFQKPADGTTETGKCPVVSGIESLLKKPKAHAKAEGTATTPQAPQSQPRVLNPSKTNAAPVTAKNTATKPRPKRAKPQPTGTNALAKADDAVTQAQQATPDLQTTADDALSQAEQTATNIQPTVDGALSAADQTKTNMLKTLDGFKNILNRKSR
jgi:hypothetical protein